MKKSNSNKTRNLFHEREKKRMLHTLRTDEQFLSDEHFEAMSCHDRKYNTNNNDDFKSFRVPSNCTLL